MTEILICWVGATDLKASLGKDLVGLGPIAQAAMERSYDEVALISDYTSNNTAPYI
jgi:hypothetical protein